MLERNHGPVITDYDYDSVVACCYEDDDDDEATTSGREAWLLGCCLQNVFVLEVLKCAVLEALLLTLTLKTFGC